MTRYFEINYIAFINVYNPKTYSHDIEEHICFIFYFLTMHGVCPIDQIDLKIPVNPPLQITAFSANAMPVCEPTGVLMKVNFTPPYTAPRPCTYMIEWYKDGQIIHTSTNTSGVASYTYTPAMPELIAGNFFCCKE